MMLNAVKKMRTFSKKYYGYFIYFLSQSAFASSAGGGGDDMPWNPPLEKVKAALSGTTAHSIIVIAIILTGIGFAIGEHGGLIRKALGIIFGGSIAVGATSLYATLSIGGALI